MLQHNNNNQEISAIRNENKEKRQGKNQNKETSDIDKWVG